MDLNWDSPWEHEASTSTNPPTSNAPIPSRSRDDRDSSWSLVDSGGAEWATDVQDDWASYDGKSQRERRLSETFGWGTSDGQGRAAVEQQNLGLRPASLQLPLRSSSPDPWATGSFQSESAHVREDSGAEAQKEENPPEIKIVEQVEGDLNSAPENGSNMLGGVQSEGEDDKAKFQSHDLPQQASQLIADGALSFQQNQAETTSSRPSSSPSNHGDDIRADSSRTSFEQDPEEDPSKVQELVLRFDSLAREDEETCAVTNAGSLNNINSIDTTRQKHDPPAEESDIDDFGDFEEETEDFNFPKNEAPKTNFINNHHGVSFSVDPKLLETLLSEICPESSFSADQTQQTSNDVFTTIEERKTWHRISRYGTMRKHDTGNDENYRRVKWQNSKIRDETIKIVSRWRGQDSMNGCIALGGGDGGSMFGWDDRSKRNSGPINMSAIWAEKALKASKHRSMPVPLPSKAAPKSPLPMLNKDSVAESKPPLEDAPRFGWSTEDNKTTMSKESLPNAPSPRFSLQPPPKASAISSPPSPTLSTARPTSMDFTHHPRIASLKGLGHRSTMSLDGQHLRPIPAPLLATTKPTVPNKPVILAPAVKESFSSKSSTQLSGEDDDDWGDMVSSTPDLDGFFKFPSEPIREVQVNRNRADSTPQPVPDFSPLEQVPQTKRPISLHFGAPPPSSFSGSVSLLSSDVTKLPQEQKLSVPVPRVPEPKSERPPSPRNPIPTMPRLSSITDDFDAWSSAPAPAISASETVVEASQKDFTVPKLTPKPLEATADDFDAWGSFDDLPTPTKTSNGTMAATTNTTTGWPSKPDLPPLNTTTTTEMDGWSNADFSIFETATPAPAPTTSYARKEPQGQVTRHFEATQKEMPKSDVPRSKDPQKNQEEERIVKSIVGKLPDLSYMFRR